MNIRELMGQMKNCAIFFYQNKEEEAYQKFTEILPQINAYLQSKIEADKNAAPMVLNQMQSLITAYQKRDQLALADWLYIESIHCGLEEDGVEAYSGAKSLDEIKIENKQALREVWGDFYAKYEAVQIDSENKYCLEETVYKDAILGIVEEDYEYRMNSIYNPDMAARQYALRYKDIKDYSVIGIFGLSDGKAVRKFLELCNATQTIIIYEPDINFFAIAMEQFYLADIIRRDNVYLVVEGINERKLEVWVDRAISYQARDLLVQGILPNYDVLYSRECANFIDMMVRSLKRQVFNKNTEILHSIKIGDNILKNIPYVLNESSINILSDYVKQQGYQDCPAIIVSAGPSLDKNIKDLKKAEGKAFILGVDSALKPLARENIHIQLAISVDPNKNPKLFEEEKLNDYPYVVSSFSLPIITKKNRNRLFFDAGCGFEVYEDLIEKKIGKKIGTTRTGGSVATDAFSILVDMGFKNIVFVGQDLAFTGGQDHVSGFDRSKANERPAEMIVDVEGYDGEMIKTDMQMAFYREWFEREIKQRRGEITVIDATEGGAKIQGARNMTLSDMIDEYCKEEVDFDKIIAEAPYLCTKEEKLLIKDELLETEQRLLELEDRLRDAITVYDDLIQMEETGRQTDPKYKGLIEQITEINNIEETEMYLKFVSMYSKEAEYIAADDIYVAEELTVTDIAKRGKALLEGFIQGSKVCREHVRELMIPDIKNL